MTSSELLPKTEDVNLACAFIPNAEKRAEVLVLYAFLETLRDIPERVTDPLMGEIRLRWWYEAIEDVESGRTPRYHPLTEALQGLIRRYAFAPKAFYDLIEGQMPLLDKGELTIKDALTVADKGEGSVARLASVILGKKHDLTAIARLNGMAQIKAKRGISDAGETEFAHLRREAVAAAKGLPVELMPLALPAALASAHWHGQLQGPLIKRLCLLWAYISGNI